MKDQKLDLMRRLIMGDFWDPIYVIDGFPKINKELVKSSKTLYTSLLREVRSNRINTGNKSQLEFEESLGSNVCRNLYRLVNHCADIPNIKWDVDDSNVKANDVGITERFYRLLYCAERCAEYLITIKENYAHNEVERVTILVGYLFDNIVFSLSTLII